MGNNSSHSEYGLTNRSRCSNFIPRRQYYQNRVTDPCGFNTNHLRMPMSRPCTAGESFRNHTGRIQTYPRPCLNSMFGDSGYMHEGGGNINVDKTNDDNDWTQVDTPPGSGSGSGSVTPKEPMPLSINPVTNTPRGYEPYNPFNPNNFIVNKVESETDPTNLPSYTYLPEDNRNYLKSPDSGDISSSPSTPSLKSPIGDPFRDYEGPVVSNAPNANPFLTSAPEIEKKNPNKKQKSSILLPFKPVTLPKTQIPIKIPESFKHPIQIPNPSKPIEKETTKKPESEPVKVEKKNPDPKPLRTEEIPTGKPVPVGKNETPVEAKNKKPSLPDVEEVVEEPIREKRVVSIKDPKPIVKKYKTPETTEEKPFPRLGSSSPTPNSGRIQKPDTTPEKKLIDPKTRPIPKQSKADLRENPSKPPRTSLKTQPLPVFEILPPSPKFSGNPNTEPIVPEIESEPEIIPVDDLNKGKDVEVNPEIKPPSPQVSPVAPPKSTKIPQKPTSKLQVHPTAPSKKGVLISQTPEKEPTENSTPISPPEKPPLRKPSVLKSTVGNVPNGEIKTQDVNPSVSSPKLDKKPSKTTKIPIKTGKAIINPIPQKTPDTVSSIPPVNVSETPVLKKDFGIQVEPEQLDPVSPTTDEGKGPGLQIKPEEKEVETILKSEELISENPSIYNIPSPRTPEETIQSFKNLIVSLSPVRTPTPSFVLPPLRKPSSLLSFDNQVIQVQPPMTDNETNTGVKTSIPKPKPTTVRQPSIKSRTDSIPGKPKQIVEKESGPNPMEGKPDSTDDNFSPPGKDGPTTTTTTTISRRSTDDNDDDGENRKGVPPQRQNTENTGDDDSDNNRQNSPNSTETPRMVDMYLEYLSHWPGCLPSWFWLGLAMLLGYYFGKTIGSCLTVGKFNRRICYQPVGMINPTCGCSPKAPNVSTCSIKPPQISSCKNNMI